MSANFDGNDLVHAFSALGAGRMKEVEAVKSIFLRKFKK